MSESTFKRVEYTLYNYKSLEIKIKNIEIEIENLQNDVSLKAVSFEEKIAPTNSFNSGVENDVIRRDEIISKLKADKVYTTNLKRKVDNALELLTLDERKLVELRYFSNPKHSWIAIGEQLNMDKDTCCRARTRIINNISEYIFMY